MLSIKALNFIRETDAFQEKTSSQKLDVDFCLEIRLKLLPNPKDNYYCYEAYFDFGLPGISTKDILAKVKILENGTFELLELDLIKK